MSMQIATALEEQGTVAAAMDQNISNIRHSADETTETSSSMAETSERLGSQVAGMKTMVKQFSEMGNK